MSLRWFARCPRCGAKVPMTRKQYLSGNLYQITCNRLTGAHAIEWRS